MNKNIETWLVEEIDPSTGNKLFVQTFDSRSDAYDTYKQLTEYNKKSVVSVKKESKRLLLE